MIYSKEKPLTLEDLRKIPLEIPDRAGRSWLAIPHHLLVKGILKEIDARGWRIIGSGYYTTRHGMDLFGWMRLSIPSLDTIEEAPLGRVWSPGLGVATSNAQKRHLSVMSGLIPTGGLGCGVVLSETRSSPRTIGKTVQEIVEQLMIGYSMEVKRIEKRFNRLVTTEFLEHTCQKLLFEAGRRGYMPWSRIGRIDKLYREFESKPTPAWGLMKAFSRVCTMNPVSDQLDQLWGFTKIVNRQISWTSTAKV